MNSFQIVSLGLILILELAVTAARSSMLSIRYTKLDSLKESLNPDEVKRTIALITQRARLRATFKLSQFGLRFLITALILTPSFTNDLFAFLPQTLTTAVILLAGATFLLWVFEFTVELYILRKPEQWALFFTPLAGLLVNICAPILSLPLRASHSRENTQDLFTIQEEELKLLVEESEIEKDEQEMIQSVFQLDDTTAREIMIPRVEMHTLDINTPLEEAAAFLLETGHSRVPVYEGQTDNIIGLIYSKDMLKAWLSGGKIDSLKDLRRDADFFPESKKVDDLFDEMQEERRHIVILVDEFGGVSGLVTMEDIVEEIFGEIKDEYDQGEEETFQEITKEEYIFQGRIFLDEVNEIMNTALASDVADTLSGLIYSAFQGVPEVGQIIQQNGLTLTVEQISGRHIRKVRIKRSPAPQETND